MSTSDNNEFLEPLPEKATLGISWTGVLLGLVVGLSLGLFYTWRVDPVVIRNAAPDDLQSQDKQQYIIAAAREYAFTNDLPQAVTHLLAVEPDRDPFEVAADTACQLARAGQVNSLTDFEAIRSLRAIYEPQGVEADCDVSFSNTAVPITIVAPTPSITPTPTVTPVASKTPTPPVEPLPLSSPLPTATPITREGAVFREAGVQPFCDPAASGVIEIYVRDTTSAALPGTAVQVTWDNGRQQEVFFTGLKPERGDDYADFTMEAGIEYRVSVVGEGVASRALEATPCDDQGTLLSYRVVMQRFFEE